jgi:dethiobiotin synthetase
VSEQWTNADLAVHLKSPVVLVAGNRLGVINHTLLSIAAIRQTCELMGVVLNQLAPEARNDALPASFDPVRSNAAEIERRGDVRLWGVLTHGEDPGLESVGERVIEDWRSVLGLDPAR